MVGGATHVLAAMVSPIGTTVLQKERPKMAKLKFLWGVTNALGGSLSVDL